MNLAVNSLWRRLTGIMNQSRGNATQVFKRAMLRLGAVPPPFRIQIDITDRCNFRCPTCSKWSVAPSSKELELYEWKTAFEKFGNVPLFREISISGGEPFLRPDIYDILKLARQQRLRIFLISNGWLVNEDALQRVEEIGLDRLMISLNSLKEPIHDQSRATPGSYGRIMQLIETWRAQLRTTDLCLQTVIMEPNCGELSSMAGFVQEKGLSGIAFQVLAPAEAHYAFFKQPCMPESMANWYTDDPLWVRSVDVLHQEVSKLLRMQREGCPIINPPPQLQNFSLYFEDPEAVTTLPCLGTLSVMHIDPFGDIRLCYGYPPIGNILHDDPRQVWRSKQAKTIRKESKRCTRMCRILNNNL